ncbi:unnamed protein product [Brachionus calyciflorus]|uniref:Uncharacterized protein n=1 Tax=Brachionus calyciflorus TaxID=104777 RepID=A0A814CAV0_9BILA|nr:unnamed protein product [Brachionus calyciflorus]
MSLIVNESQSFGPSKNDSKIKPKHHEVPNLESMKKQSEMDEQKTSKSIMALKKNQSSNERTLKIFQNKTNMSFKSVEEYLVFYRNKIKHQDYQYLKEPDLNFIPTRLNKNGLPDLRFTENRKVFLPKGLNKNGTPDLRLKQNQLLLFLRKQEIFKKIEKKNYTIWTDAGTHFRCAEFLYYLFNELANEKIMVKYNIFGEKHGKNRRDQHFSVISNFVRQASLEKMLCSSQDIVDAIHKQQSLSNEYRKKRNLGPILTYAFIIEPNTQIIGNFRMVENISSYYYFFYDEKFTDLYNNY